ncbi:hypothetical protein Vafri_464 [Volvox africanus]|nr:hypothetical protein Vafri_464 [Volvox africanus]
MAVRGCSHSNSTDVDLHHESSSSTLKIRWYSCIRRRSKASQSVSHCWVHTPPCLGYSLWRSTRDHDGLLSRCSASASARGVLAGTYCGVDGRQSELNPHTQHPAMGGLRLTEIPLDLEPVSFRLAVDELERLYEIPLIAPRVFQKVAHRRALAAAGGPYAPAPAVAGVASAGTAAVRVAAAGAAALPSIPPTPQPAAGYTATGDVTCKATDVGVVAGGLPRASDLSAAESTTASAPKLHTGTAATGAFTGFLVSEHLGSRRAVMAIPPLGAIGLGEAVVPGVLEPPPSPPSQQQIQDAEGEAEAAESGQTVGPLNTDPRDFPTLPPHRLATLLLDCAARRAPLRISVLQAYVKQVSYMASELTAEELVCALEGLSKYNFQSSQPLAVSRSAGRRVSGGASNTGSGIGGSGQSGGSRPSSRWADSILKSLLEPLVSELTTPSPAAGPAGSAPAGGNRGSGSSRSRSSNSSSSGSRSRSSSRSSKKWLDCYGKRSVEGPQSDLPKVASLEPCRVVQLTKVLVQLGISPPPDWMDGFLYGSSHVVPRMSGGEVIELLELLAALSAAPAAAWWNVVLDSWPPTKPRTLPPPPPPPPPAAGGSGGECSSAEVAVTSSAGESALSRPRSVAAVTLSEGMASGSGGGGPFKTNHRIGATVRKSGSGSGSGSGDEATGQGEACCPSDLDVRSAVLYGISRLGPPHGTDVPALAARLPGWAQATLYDIARAVLVSGHLAWGAPKGPYGSRAGWSSSPPPSGCGAAAAGPSAAHPVQKVGIYSFGAAEAGGPLSDGVATGSRRQTSAPPARAAPEPRAIAQALAALPAVLPNASGWASEPSGPGSGVLAVLLAALEPRLHELPPGLMVDLLRGLAASRLHPGPRFLTLHAMILKRGSTELTPRALLLAAKCYSKLGLALKGGLRVAVLRARKALRSV